MSDKVKIEIPKEIADKIQKRVDESEFNSVSEYVEYVLKQVVDRLEEESKPKKEAFSKEDEAKVKERLKALGYLE